MAQFLWSVGVLVVATGFGAFYLAKQLGWFGGLGLEQLRLPLGRWSRFRRRTTAVLLMALGVGVFVVVNWVLPGGNPAVTLLATLLLVVVVVVVFVLGLWDLREIRRVSRGLRVSGTGSTRRLGPRALRRLREPGGDGGSEESAEEP